jgi:outer membrane protein assembly factor BamA
MACQSVPTAHLNQSLSVKLSAHRRGLTLLVLITSLLLVLAVPASAQDTRAQRLQQQRLDKAKQLKPPERSSVEQFLYEFKERRYLERYQAGFKGFHPMLGGLSTGSGFAFGTQFRPANLAGGALNLAVSGQASLAQYQKYEMSFEAPRLAGQRLLLAFNFRQRNFPQEDFFGIGSDSTEQNRTNFRLEDTEYTASVGVRPLKHLLVGTRFGVLNTNTAPGTDKRFPSVEQLFDSATTAGVDRQPDYHQIGAFAQYDDRDEPGNPRAGGLYRFESAYYDDRDFGAYSFRRWDAEVQKYFPFFNQRRVIAVRGRLQSTDTNPGQQVPFFLLPVLGGSEDLRGFREFRFRDRQSAVVNLEYRWEAFSGLDLALFGDAGNVFEKVGDIRLDKLEKAYGVGFRFNTSKGVFLRMDIGFSHEGARTFVKFNHVF